MKHCLRFFLLFFLFCSLLAPGSPLGDEKSYEISFQSLPQTRAQILSKLEASGKPGFLFFTADWCGNCKQMEKSTFSQKRVKETVERRFVPFWIDVDKSPGYEFREFYQVGAFPTILLLGPDGSVIDILLGYLEPQELLDKLDAALRGAGTLASLKKNFSEDPENEKHAMALADFYFQTGNTRDAKPILEKLLLIAKEAKNISNILYQLGLIAQGEKKFVLACRYFERIVAEFPEFAEMERVIFNLAHYYLKSRQPEKGLVLIEKGLSSGVFQRQKMVAIYFQRDLAVAAGKWTRALAIISTIQAGSDPDSLSTSLLQAHCLMNSGREKESHALLDRMVAETKGDPDKIAELAGRCEMNDVHLALALDWMKKIVASDHSLSGDIRGLYAMLLWKNENRPEGEKELRKAIAMTSDGRVRKRYEQTLAEWQQDSLKK